LKNRQASVFKNGNTWAEKQYWIRIFSTIDQGEREWGRRGRKNTQRGRRKKYKNRSITT